MFFSFQHNPEHKYQITKFFLLHQYNDVIHQCVYFWLLQYYIFTFDTSTIFQPETSTPTSIRYQRVSEDF